MSGSCADHWGNQSTSSTQVKIDATKPVDRPVVDSGPDGATVEWNWTDALSGVDDANCQQTTSSTIFPFETLTSTCTDLAGNTVTDSKLVRTETGGLRMIRSCRLLRMPQAGTTPMSRSTGTGPMTERVRIRELHTAEQHLRRGHFDSRELHEPDRPYQF